MSDRRRALGALLPALIAPFVATAQAGAVTDPGSLPPVFDPVITLAGGSSPVGITAIPSLDPSVVNRFATADADGTVRVYRRGNDGTFAVWKTIRLAPGLSAIAAGGLEAGTQKALVVTNSRTDTVSVLLPTSTGYAGPVTYPVGREPVAIAIARDIVVANRGDGTVSILHNRGDGTFDAARSYPSGGSGPDAIGVLADASGYEGIVVANYASDTVTVLTGDGTGGFGNPTVLARGDGPSALATPLLVDDGLGGNDIVVAYRNSSSAQVIYHDPSGFRAQPPFPTVEHPTAVSAAGYMSEYNFNPTHGADLAGPYLAFSNDKAVSLVGGLDYSSSSERTDISLGSGVIGTAPFDVDGDRLVDLVAATPSGVLVRRNAFVLKPTVWDVLTGATTADGEMDLSAGYFAFPQPAVRLQRAAPGSATFVNTAGLTTQWYPAAARIGIGADRSIGLDEAGARYRLVLTNAVGMVHSAPLTVSWTTINSVTTITSGGVRYLDVHYTVRPATVDPALTVRVVSSTDGVCSATVAAGHCTMRYSGAESWVTARFGAPGYFGSTTQKDLP